MKILITGFIAFLIWSAISTYWYVCKIKNFCGEPVPVKTETLVKPAETTGYHYFILDKPDTVARFEQPISASLSSADVMIPSTTQGIYDSISNYLFKTPGRQVVIKSYYSGTEENNSDYDNLGLARAEVIRAGLLSRGINTDLIKTESYEKNLDFKDGESAGAIEISITEIEAIAPGEFVLHFAFDKSDYIKVDQFESFATKVLEYLQNQQDKNLLITGHTDNIGSSQYNMDIGFSRARNIEKFFVERGLSKGNIVVSSSGENEPVADNDTETGRAANRRAVLTVK